ncbi:MAG: hypothetical protein H6Q03_1454 [Acidobacteria bacterium]|nr:hypothetical protein [Acidobacteriota bacterium]
MLARVLDYFARRPAARPAHTLALPADLLARVRRIEITTKRLVDHGVAGNYHSVFRGRGVEFSEVRPYQPGDDVRAIDWNRTARMGAPFVKVFHEERDLTVFLAVDVSGSLRYGSRAIAKRELAAEVAALLAFAALRNQDRVGAALLSDRVDLFLPPARRRNRALRLVHEILSRPARGATDLETALGGLLASLHQRSVLFLISDFVGAAPEAALQRAASRHDLVVLEIVDPRDLEPPAVGPVVLEDAETGEVAFVDGRRSAAPEAARAGAERQRLHRLLGALGVDRLELRTDRPYLPELVAFFDRRKRRMAR